MTRSSIIADTAALALVLVLALALAACGGGDDYQVMQPDEIDAAVDGRGGSNDAMRDAAIDGSPTGADLSIAISDSPDAVAASSTLEYTLDVTNHGGLDASDIVVTQRLPPGNIAFRSATGIGWMCTASGQLVTCLRDTLLVGAAPSIVVEVTTPPLGGSITTTAAVEADTPDPDTANNDASADTMVLTPANLAIAISGSPDPVAAGEQLRYTITVTNLGPGTSSGLGVLDGLPSSVAFVSASGIGWSCSVMAGTVTCLNPILVASASSTITLIVTAPASGGTVSNTAMVVAATPDANQSNNQATAITTVNAAADLSIAMADSPDPVLGSGLLQYAIDVDNRGPNTASGITVTNNLPAGNVTFVSAVGTGWTCAAPDQVVSCTRPSLLVGAAPTITITVQAPSESATLIDVATVASTSSDLVSVNNSATETTEVQSPADLSIAVIDSPDPVSTTAALDYIITASNAGPNQAVGVSITSDLAPGTQFHSATGFNWACTAAGQRVICTTPMMVVGPAPAITIATSAPAGGGDIIEMSSITSTTPDQTPGNNTASQRTTVDAPSDLGLVLSPALGQAPAGSTLTCTLDVTNFGPRDATDLIVSNRLPDGNVLFLNAGGIGWACNLALAGQIVTCTRPLLIVGAAPSIIIQIKTPDANGPLIDVASVSASTADLNLTNNAASSSLNVFDSADLSITASDSPDPVPIHTGEVTYTLSIANDGPTSAAEISVVDELPDGTTLVSAGGTGWSCIDAPGIVTCTMDSLGASSSASAISVVVTAPATSGNMTNTATVSSSTFDPEPANDAVNTVTLANEFADLSVEITDVEPEGGPDPVQGTTQPGCGATNCTTYPIDVSNAGPDLAIGVKVVIALPANGAFYNAVGDGWICPAPGVILTCTRTSLAIGAAPTIYLTWKAPSPGGFSIVVTPTVSAASTDPDAANNTATEDTTVLP